MSDEIPLSIARIDVESLSAFGFRAISKERYNVLCLGGVHRTLSILKSDTYYLLETASDLLVVDLSERVTCTAYGSVDVTMYPENMHHIKMIVDEATGKRTNFDFGIILR